MKYELIGRIDSQNASAVEEDVISRIDNESGGELVLDAEKLAYISSAGLRVLLRIRKSYPQLRIVNVSSDVYEILEMTGFTEIIPVEKAYRTVSLEGCELIGRGAKGRIYRIDRDNVVKVYTESGALDDIKHEREMAKLALILGVPTAISYDVIKVGGGYGSVFELLNARSFSQIIAEEPEKLDWCAKEYAMLLRKIHSTVVPEGKAPDIRARMNEMARCAAECLPADHGRKLISLVDSIPYDSHMLHGDYHTNNLEFMGGEVILIDMDTLSTGHPVFELGIIFSAFVGFSEKDPKVIERFLGIDRKAGEEFWRRALEYYLGALNGDKLREVEDKARTVGYMRLVSHAVKYNYAETENGREELEHWKTKLAELLDSVDSLRFPRMNAEFPAEVKELSKTRDFIDEHLISVNCPAEERARIELAAEEVFVNIAGYAYGEAPGTVSLHVEAYGDPAEITVVFADRGVRFDPLLMKDPDTSLPAQERDIGGLGIFLTKQLMDNVEYEYRDGQNVLTLKKRIKTE